MSEALTRPHKSKPGGQPALDLLEYAEVPLRRPLLLLVPLVICAAGAVIASVVLPKKFKSQTLILVESGKVPETFVKAMATENQRQRMFTIKQEILSRTRLERIIREIDPYPQLMSRAPLTNIIEEMRRDIAINVKGADAFSIEFVHGDPKKAMDVTQRLATLFIEESSRERELQVEGASEFLQTQLDEARRELEKKEEDLRKFKEKRMGTLPAQQQANLSTLSGLRLQQQAITESLRSARDRQAMLERGLVDTSLLPPSGAARPRFDAGNELQRLRAELQQLRSRYTDEHPDVKSLLARLEPLERSAQAAAAAETAPGASPAVVDPAMTAARAQIEQARHEVALIQAKAQDIEQRIQEYQARVELEPRTEQELVTLTRDYDKLNDHYTSLLNRKLEAQMSEKMEQRWKGEHFRILDPAHYPERPVFPNRLLLIALGVGLGLVLGLGSCFVAEFLDHSVKNVRDLEAVLPFPILATVPFIPDPQGGKGVVSVAEAARDL